MTSLGGLLDISDVESQPLPMRLGSSTEKFQAVPKSLGGSLVLQKQLLQYTRHQQGRKAMSGEMT